MFHYRELMPTLCKYLKFRNTPERHCGKPVNALLDVVQEPSEMLQLQD